MSICPIINPFSNFIIFQDFKRRFKHIVYYTGTLKLIKSKQFSYHRSCGGLYGYSKNVNISFSDSKC